MTTEHQFTPIVSVFDDGRIETDWFSSYVWSLSETGEELLDEDGVTGSDILDERLASIRALLVLSPPGTAPLADLVRPFFEKPT